MKSTGIVRKVDELGRIVLPIELRRTLDINIKDSIEIFTDEDQIILQEYMPGKACIITGEVSNNNITLANGKIILSPEGMRRLSDELHQVIKQ